MALITSDLLFSLGQIVAERLNCDMALFSKTRKAQSAVSNKVESMTLVGDGAGRNSRLREPGGRACFEAMVAY